MYDRFFLKGARSASKIKKLRNYQKTLEFYSLCVLLYVYKFNMERK